MEWGMCCSCAAVCGLCAARSLFRACRLQIAVPESAPAASRRTPTRVARTPATHSTFLTRQVHRAAGPGDRRTVVQREVDDPARSRTRGQRAARPPWRSSLTREQRPLARMVARRLPPLAALLFAVLVLPFAAERARGSAALGSGVEYGLQLFTGSEQRRPLDAARLLQDQQSWSSWSESASDAGPSSKTEECMLSSLSSVVNGCGNTQSGNSTAGGGIRDATIKMLRCARARVSGGRGPHPAALVGTATRERTSQRAPGALLYTLCRTCVLGNTTSAANRTEVRRAAHGGWWATGLA